MLAQLVVAVDLAGLFAALAAAAPRDLLAVVPLLEWTDDLDHVVANLPGEQVDAVVAELHPGELADLALALDPSRFGPIVGRIDDRTVVAIAVELVGRGEHRALARFAVVVTPAQLDAVLAEAAEHDVEAVLLHLPPDLAATVLDRASARG